MHRFRLDCLDLETQAVRRKEQDWAHMKVVREALDRNFSTDDVYIPLSTAGLAVHTSKCCLCLLLRAQPQLGPRLRPTRPAHCRTTSGSREMRLR